VSPPGIEAAAEALAAGQVVAIPTDTVYGLAVDPRLEGAPERVFALKNRPEQFALPVLIAEPVEMAQLALVSEAAARLAASYWPGALTLVLSRRAEVIFDLGGDRETIGLRCPAHGALRRLLKITGPLAVTSANYHGQAPLHTAGEVREHFGAGLMVLDGGRCDAKPSTVVSLIGAEPVCLREGAIAFGEIARSISGS
jgi:tRNA threonylcarbamoyl adenosine modification protein (Sua5/YciO/YrdC/YwlC family)